MTPDRTDQMHADDAEHEQHGVLSDTGSVETSGIGFLGGHTEQVSVVLPSSSDDDDDVDDDVVDDEVAYSGFAEGEDDSEDGAYAADADAEDAVTGEIEVDEWTAAQSLYGSAASVEEIEDASVVDDAVVDDAVVEEGPGDEAAIVEDAVVDGDSAVEDSAPPAPVTAPPVAPAPDATRAATRAATGPVPATRWEAQHPAAPARPDHAVERIIPRADVSMSSKRLGEFEAGRETADLLTADRLLDPHHIVRPEPEGAWQHFVYSISLRRINLGDGKRARARKELDRRIAAPLTGGARFVPVLSRKGGVGKTTVTTLLGMALADARDDRIIAVDANPDRGTLAERISRSSGKTVRDLVKVRSEVTGYNDISNIVARDETRLDVLASDADPRVSEALNDRDYHDIASLAAHYYSIVLTDTGTGIVHSVMGATLDLADQLVVVAGLSVDEARLASETLTWLETNGYSEQVRNAVVVLNTARPGTPLVRADELEAHFRTRVRSVVRVPYDPHIAAGSAISFRELQPATRLAARDLAAAVVEGLRALAPAA